ncbi:glycosyl hydrolase catalytic core-domain-containing protein [Xylaria arbuscula]|nr:glycosyl hydrolase catalytic core-domain-containing protein [Xylaria arbuscula]
MYSKTSLMALCAAVAVKEVAAGHGHQHAHADKREIVWAATETVVVTDYVVVTVTEGDEPTAAAVDTTSVAATTTSEVHRPHHTHHTKQSSATSTATSESSTPVVIQESTSTPIAIPTSTSTSSVEVPTVSSTTLATVTRPATSTPVEETPVVTPTAEEVTSIVSTTSVASTTSSSSAAPVATSNSGKRGLAFNDASLVQEYISLGGEASWAYNWYSAASGLPDGVTFYPMLWSPAPDHSNGWDENVNTAIANGADALLSFNEPDIAAQANMSPADAAAGHIQWMNPYSGSARISTPAISSSDNPNQGIDWLKQFFSACNGQCAYDFCAAHWYGPGGEDGAALFLQHLKDVNQACDGKPVWVTEFAAESGDINTFVSTIIKELETDEYSFVEKYSYFYAAVGSLFENANKLATIGEIYAGLPVTS